SAAVRRARGDELEVAGLDRVEVDRREPTGRGEFTGGQFGPLLPVQAGAELVTLDRAVAVADVRARQVLEPGEFVRGPEVDGELVRHVLVLVLAGAVAGVPPRVRISVDGVARQ